MLERDVLATESGPTSSCARRLRRARGRLELWAPAERSCLLPDAGADDAALDDAAHDDAALDDAALDAEALDDATLWARRCPGWWRRTVCLLANATR